jgi:phage shock protein A
MWQRFTRLIRSFVGFFISTAENPEIILEQNIRDMNDQVPRMNESIAMVKANVTLLEREESKYQDDLANLTAKVKAAIQSRRHCRQLCHAASDHKGRAGAHAGPACHGPCRV